MAPPPLALHRAAPTAELPAHASLRSRAAVLLVEDDEILSPLFNVLLDRCGCEVVAARDGAGCLKAFAERESALAFVLMDCSLPDIQGGVLAVKLRQLCPGLPILLTSGKKQDALMALLTVDGPTCFLAKPFTADLVRSAVRGMLAMAE